MPHEHHVTVYTRDEMIADLDEFYTDRVPGDDRDPEMFRAFRVCSPLQLMTSHGAVLAARAAAADAVRLRKRLRWASIAMWSYLLAIVLVTIRFAFFGPRTGPDTVMSFVVIVVVTAAVASYLVADHVRKGRRK